MFLIRTAFWLSIVVLLIPIGDAQRADGDAGADLSTSEAITAARSTVSDLAGFCARNPETCETGSEALEVFTQKAQHGAKMLYEYLAELDLGDDRTAITGTDTLNASDRDIPWQGSEAALHNPQHESGHLAPADTSS